MCAFEIYYLSTNRRQCEDSYKVYMKSKRSKLHWNTLKTVVKRGKLSWNVQVLENLFLLVPLTYIQKLSLLTSLISSSYLFSILCICDVMAASQTWVRN